MLIAFEKKNASFTLKHSYQNLKTLWAIYMWNLDFKVIIFYDMVEKFNLCISFFVFKGIQMGRISSQIGIMNLENKWITLPIFAYLSHMRLSIELRFRIIISFCIFSSINLICNVNDCTRIILKEWNELLLLQIVMRECLLNKYSFNKYS